MTIISNTAPDRSSLHAVKGDSIDLTLYVNSEITATGRKFYVQADQAPASGSAYAMTALHMQVRRKDGLLIKDWVSGVSPSDIVIGSGYFHLTDDGFDQSGFFDYDVQDDNFTIMRGTFYVEKETTL